MNLEVNQLVLTPFGYGNIISLPPLPLLALMPPKVDLIVEKQEEQAQPQQPTQPQSQPDTLPMLPLPPLPPLPPSSLATAPRPQQPPQPIQPSAPQPPQQPQESQNVSPVQEQVEHENNEDLPSQSAPPPSSSQSEQPTQVPSQQLSPQAPKAPSLDPIIQESLAQIPQLKNESGDDPFPFANMNVSTNIPNPPALPKQIQPQFNPLTKKPPFAIQLGLNIRESLEQAKELREARITLDDQRIVQVKLKCDHVAFLSARAKDLDTCLYLLVKTFYQKRLYYLVCVQFNAQLKSVIKLVSEASCDNPKMLHSIRVVYPMGNLTEFKDHNVLIQDLNLPQFSQVIMMAQTTFFWDPNSKGAAITLSNNNLTANKQGDSDFQTVLGTLPMSSGRHYWELKIDKFVDDEDLFIGIARKEIDLYAQPITTGMFWGYICLCARKCGPEGVLTKYGQSAKIGDIIGVLLEFRGGVGTLSFYRNGAKCGEAFNNLTGTLYPAVSLLYGEVQVTLDPKAAFPIN